MAIKQLFTKIRAIIRPRRPRPVILMYHRVAFARHDPWGLAVNPERFEEQIAFIQQHRTPLPMEKLVERILNGTLPANAVAVTFDDGYRDNLINAKPVLAKYRVPATVFVATGFINQDAPFWWDELASMILASPGSVHDFEVWMGEKITLNWDEPEHSDLTGEWRAYNPPQTARQKAYLEIWRTLRSMSAEERNLAMNKLRKRLGTISNPLAKPMTSDEVRALLCGELIQLGAHTVTHPALTLLNRLESRREINDSARMCCELAGKFASGFAYPYGDLNLEVRNDVVKQDFRWACSTESSFLDGKEAEIYALPRVAAPNAPLRSFVKLITA